MFNDGKQAFLWGNSMDKVQVKVLVQTHKHGGVIYHKGEIFNVPQGQADWLVDNKVCTILKPDNDLSLKTKAINAPISKTNRKKFK